ERVGAVVDVEKRSLRSLEEDARAGPGLAMQVERRVTYVRPEPDPECGVLARDRRRVERRQLGPRAPGEQPQLVQRAGEPLLDLAPEARGIQQITHADPSARHLVLVRRADAAASGADRRGAACLLAQHVEVLVPGKDDVCRFGEDEL